MSATQTRTLSQRHIGENAISRLLRSIGIARRRHSQRQMLARLDSRLLRDIGLAADTAAKECAKPFWQA